MIPSSKIKENAVVALDPGPVVSGMVIVEDGAIAKASNAGNAALFNIMFDGGKANVRPLVLIEDVRPYGVRLSQDFIDTCKWIGELEYRLKTLNIAYKLIPRSTVKKWIFDTFPDIAVPRIEKEIILRDHRRKDGEYCKPSAGFVNDRIIREAMKKQWSIPTPKPGKTNAYGLSEHSWQALGLASYWIAGPSQTHNTAS